MKHIIPAFVLLLVIPGTQAAEVPFVELEGHRSEVTSAVFSPDGKKVLTAGMSDGIAKIWDVESGKELQTLGVVGVPAYFSPDGKKIITARAYLPNIGRSSVNTAAIWDIESGEELQRFRGHTQPVGQAFFSPDGKKIVTASQDNTAKIWDAESGKELQTFTGHTSYVNYVAFSPDGKKIVTASTDNTVRIWDVESGEELKMLEGLANPRSVSFSPDGTKILAGSVARVAVIWDAETGRALQIFREGHTDSVNSVAFSPDGKTIATGGIDGNAHIWDAETGEKLRTMTHSGNKVAGIPPHLLSSPDRLPGILFIAFSPDGKKVVTSSHDATARIWTLE